MRHNNTIINITLTGMLTALAVIAGVFLRFPINGGDVYIVGIIVFMMPVVLDYKYSSIGAFTSVLLTDLFTGWIAYVWISIIAYVSAVLIIRFAVWYQGTSNVIFGIILASFVAFTIYFFLEWIVFGESFAIAAAAANAPQFAIVTIGASLLYIPIKVINERRN